MGRGLLVVDISRQRPDRRVPDFPCFIGVFGVRTPKMQHSHALQGVRAEGGEACSA